VVRRFLVSGVLDDHAGDLVTRTLRVALVVSLAWWALAIYLIREVLRWRV